MTLLWLLVLLIGIAVIAHLRVSPVPALAIVAAYLVLMGAAEDADLVDGHPLAHAHCDRGALARD